MTIALTVMLCVLTYLYPEDYGETFKSCIVMVVTFYFAHQQDKSTKASHTTTESEDSGWMRKLKESESDTNDERHRRIDTQRDDRLEESEE